ncbi:MAG: ATP-binding cassette domain-containing protein [Bacilli bacterium]|nr:ATP-binding cassette domain-containing protein [Bacilli bacterium]
MENYKTKINRKIIKKAKKEFLFKYIISIALRLVVLLTPILFSKAIDNVTDGNFDKAYTFIFIVIGLVIFLRLGEIFNTFLFHKLYNKLYQNYNKLALQSTYDNSIFSLSRISNSEFINIINNDIAIIANFLCSFVIRSIRIIEFVVIIIYFYTINLYVGISGTIVSIISFIILYLSSSNIETVNKKKAYDLDSKTNVMTEFFLGIKEIKNFNIFNQIQDRSKKYTSDYASSFLTQRVVEDSYKFGVTLLIDLFRYGLVIYGIILISKGELTIGVLLVIYNYFAQLTDNFSELTNFNINYRQFIVAKNRYYKLIEYTQNQDDNKDLRHKDFNGLIEFKNILYGYRDNPTLDNVSFVCKPNTINVITGKSGSGKTGVFDLLLKLNRQHEGDLTIDNININDYDNDYYFDNISHVNKEPTFFNMSLRENLNIINNDFSKVVKICKDLGIHEEIIQLKEGYDTIINSNGSPLNPNLIYFLGIARGLVRESKIMLFDEAFDAFDKETRLKIIKLLKEYKNNHVIIIITKEPDFLKIADQVLLIDKSTVIKTGKHEELKNNTLYQSIIKK